MVQKILYSTHAIAIGLLPIGLSFWYFFSLKADPNPRIYLTYTDILVYLSDGLAIVALLSWFVGRLVWHEHDTVSESRPRRKRLDMQTLLSSATPWLFSLCVVGSFSAIWSEDWRLSFYISLHLWLAFGLFLSLKDRSGTWRAFALGGCAALSLQVLFGLWQVAAQSTAFLAPLRLTWPGSLVPSIRGASVVQLLDGTRWLRAYGSLPHPNILGGMTIVFIAGTVGIYLLFPKRIIFTAIIFGPGLILLVLTFSRSAWLGFLTGALFLGVNYRKFNRKRMLHLAILAAICLALVVIPMRKLIFTRVSNAPVFTEQLSTQTRIQMARQSTEIIRAHPWLGVGLGAYTFALTNISPGASNVEPVHDLPLLVTSELGIPGAIILIGLLFVIGRAVIRTRTPEVVIFSACIAGLIVLGLFDHYLWSLAPGRMLLAATLGIWAGQIGREEIDPQRLE